MDSRVLKPVHVHVDYNLSVDELNEYTLRHANWLNTTTLNLLADGTFGFHHQNDLDGVYIHRWISHNEVSLCYGDTDTIHSILGSMNPDEDIILLFEERNCYMVYIV
jgi:hypothetical protein